MTSEVSEGGVVQAPETIELHTTEERRAFLSRQNRERPGFISVREQVTYSPPKGRSAVSSTVRYGYQTRSKEQAWSRQTEAEESPCPLEWGWFRDKPEEIGEVLIVNNEDRFERNPTEEERREMDRKVLLVYFGDVVFAVVEPGRSMRLQPCLHDHYSIGSGPGAGSVEYTLTVFPR